MTPESDWRWLLTVRVRAGEQTPYEEWIWWHYHCLLPATPVT